MFLLKRDARIEADPPEAHRRSQVLSAGSKHSSSDAVPCCEPSPSPASHNQVEKHVVSVHCVCLQSLLGLTFQWLTNPEGRDYKEK